MTGEPISGGCSFTPPPLALSPLKPAALQPVPQVFSQLRGLGIPLSPIGSDNPKELETRRIQSRRFARGGAHAGQVATPKPGRIGRNATAVKTSAGPRRKAFGRATTRDNGRQKSEKEKKRRKVQLLPARAATRRGGDARG